MYIAGAIPLEGKTINRLTVIKRTTNNNFGTARWICKCLCGKKVIISSSSLLNSRGTKSCGCLKREKAIEKLKKRWSHGMTNTKTYRIWAGMKSRCLDKNVREFKWYGGRGIKVCKRWIKFENFFADMGERPENMTLDRKDNNGNYSKRNCRWATQEEQANNTSKNRFLTFNGKTQTITQWSKELKIDYELLHSRVRSRKRNGWSDEKILTAHKYTRK